MERGIVLRAAREAAILSLSLIPFAITYGLLVRQAGIHPLLGLLFSMLLFTGSAQLVVVSLMMAGAGFVEMALATIFINLRYVLMAGYLSTYVKMARRRLLPLYALSVSTWTPPLLSAYVAEGRPAPHAYLLAIAIATWLGWTVVSAVGLSVATQIPPSLETAARFAFPALLIGLIFSMVRRLGPGLSAVLVAGLVSLALTIVVPPQWAMIMGAMAGATAGAMWEWKAS
jgi:predicted branched-subunit amino acid permease